MSTQTTKIEITKPQLQSSNITPPENSEGFLFLEAPDINSLLFFGGTSKENFGLYLYDILNFLWTKPELKGDIPPIMSHFAGWYDTPYLFIHGGKSLTENKSLKETYLIDIEAMIVYKIFTIEEPSSRYGHIAVKNNDKQAYIFGGCNIGKKNERFLSDLHKMEYKNISVIAGDNTNINGASWIVNIQTKGDKPAGRKGYSMLFIENLNNLLIYGGELKDNKINDECAYLYNIDEKEYKKIFFKDESKNNLVSRAYHTMHLNDTNNKIYIIGGINSNKEILDDIIEINLNGKEIDNQYNKYKANEIFNKRYGHKGCNIFIGDNDDDLMYHIIILGGKKNDKEFYDFSLIDFFIQGDNNNSNKKENKYKEVNVSSEIKNESINENDINIQIEKNQLKNNKADSELKVKRKEYVETLNNLQKEFIDLYLKNQKISSEYYQNLSKLNELKNKELFDTILKNISYEKKKKEINFKREKINREFDEYNQKLKENMKFNELLNEYMNVYKERFCVLSEFLYEYIEDIMKADKFIVENCSNSIDINFDEFANKRKSYRLLIINLLQDIKKYGAFENDLYNNLVKIRENYPQQSESSSIRNTIQKVVKKEKKFDNEFDQ